MTTGIANSKTFDEAQLRALINDRVKAVCDKKMPAAGHRLNIGKTEYFRAMFLDISVLNFNWGTGRLLKRSYQADMMILRANQQP
jgi:hypothetical protein